MIALNEDRAFYGVPSDRVSPRSYERVSPVDYSESGFALRSAPYVDLTGSTG
jgi:hypothetical protein